MEATHALFSSFASNFKGQLVARSISFAINMYLLRRIEGDLLGIVNVSLTLFYTTSIFLVREPMRKAFLSSEIPLSSIVAHAWLSPLLSVFVSLILYFCFWIPFSTIPPVNIVPSYSYAIFLFGFASWIESVAEPFIIFLLELKRDDEYAFLQGILVVLQRIFVLFLIFILDLPHIDAFCYAQVLSSAFYLCFTLMIVNRNLCSRRYVDFNGTYIGFKSLLPNFTTHLSMKELSLLATFSGHSLFKQLLADGSSYVLTFTNWISLSNQAAYESIEKLGSLVARIVLAPLEHSAYLYFSSSVQRNTPYEEQNHMKLKEAVRALCSLLHVTVTISSIVCVFAIPYSPIAVYLYGGNLLSNNSGAGVLRLYCMYILVIAVNGITECFAMATMHSSQIFSHGRFLLLAAPLHLFFSAYLSFYLSAYGLILANTFNMLLRITYSWNHISRFLSSDKPSILNTFPYPMTIVLLIFSLIVSSVSLLIFGRAGGIIHNAAHLAIGGALFSFVMNHVYQTDLDFRIFANSIAGSFHPNKE